MCKACTRRDGDYDMEITLKPRTDYVNVGYGLITPDGSLYSCGYTDHGYLVNELEDAGILDENSNEEYGGSVHVSGADFDLARYRDYKRVTQKQLDTMFDYMLAHGNTFPFDELEIVDASTKTGKISSATFRAVQQSAVV